jgi:hypothetical protein
LSRTPATGAAPPELPGYRFVKDIGSGGNAQVYLYEQYLPSRKVAVKVLNESALSEVARRRFTAEANVTAGLAHPHIVQVFEANVTPDGRPYLVMPYYPQPNMSVRARRSHFSVADVLRIGIQIGSAVETSHRGGVLHRDIKPQNILADSYGPALTDFGIATTRGGDGPEGLSVPWSPPEILFGTGPGDERSDVYSLGATLWHLLVGRSPFDVPGDNGRLALMGRIRTDPPPRTQRNDVPDSLERLLRQAMAKDPAARPQSAMELIRGLQSVEQELRLPLTQPVLAVDEPRSETQGSDTIALSRQGLPGPAQPARGNTSQPGWGAPAREESTSRAGGPAGPWAPQGPGPAADNDNVTLQRAPLRIDPRGPAMPAAPAGGDAWRNAAAPGAPRARQFPREAPEAATVARPSGGAHAFDAAGAPPADRVGTGPGGTATAGSPDVAGPGPRKSGRGRVLALVGGGAALAVAAGIAVVALSHGDGQPQALAPTSAVTQTSPGEAENAIAQGDPSPPTISETPNAVRTQVKFSWTHQDAAPGAVFLWRLTGTVPHKSSQTSNPELTVAVPAGKEACLTVRVEDPDGGASTWSDPVCGP